MKPGASSPVSRTLHAARRWLKNAWLSRLSILDRVRGLFGRRRPCAAWESSGKPVQVRLALEILERRETPDDVFGLLHAPMLGTGLALLGGQFLTPAAVLVDGWSAGQTPTPSPHATATDGGRAPGMADVPPHTPPSFGAHATEAAAGSTGPAGPAAPTSFDGGGARTADDPFADPLGGDWLDAVDKALSAETPPAAHASSGGGPSGGAATAAAPTGPVAAPAAGSSFAADADSGLAGAASLPGPTAAPAAVAAPANASDASAASTPLAPSDASSPDGGGQGTTTPPQASAFLQAYGRTQLAFEPNEGQTSSQVNFLSHGPGFETFLTNSGATLALPAPALNGAPAQDVLDLSFDGANPAPQVYATGQLPSASNYFIGDDPSQWLSDVPNYSGVVYHDLYPGVDVTYSGDSQKELEYTFTVAPGADPSQIELSWQGAQSVTTDQQGDLVLTTASGQTLTATAPVLYQTTAAGVSQSVSGGYLLNADGTVGFQVGAYDSTRPLVIDPTIVYSSYLGGSGDDKAYAVAVDASGAAYVTGSTTSGNFPTASGYQTSNAGSTDVFVTKLNAQGSGLVYSTYVGGSSPDVGYGIAVDLSGRAWVVGQTDSTINMPPTYLPFPTTSDAYLSSASTIPAAFALRLSAAGDQLTYSTFMGSATTATAVAVDALGAAYVTGYTSSTAFPTTSGAFQTSLGGGSGTDAFVAKLAPTLPGSTYSVTLAYSSYLGGSSTDEGQGVAVDGAGDAYVTGSTQSSNFPTTAGAFKTTKPAGTQASFVAKINPSGSALSYATYLSGGAADAGYGIAVDRQDDAYVTGSTGSSFPTTAGAFQTSTFSAGNGFVAKLNPSGAGLTYGTYLAATSNRDSGFISGAGVAVDDNGQATVVGATSASTFPTTSGAPQTSYGGGGDDAFVVQLNAAGSSENYGTYLGGSAVDEATGVGLDALGAAYAVGYTDSSNFPTSQGAFQTGAQGGYDAFITKIAQVPAPPVFTAISPDTGSSSTDRVTDTGNVTITGAAAANATVTLSQEGVGVLGAVTASASGLWTSTYYASSHTLPQGTAAFSASQTVGGVTSDPSADWLVTVDETAPVVTVSAPASTASTNPMLLVTAADQVGLAVPATVTVQVYNATGSTLLNTDSSAATLTDGQASFRLAYTLTPGTTYLLKAQVNDLAGNTGTSAGATVSIVTATLWAAGTAEALSSDPVQGDPLLQLGDVQDSHDLDLDQSGGGQDGGADLVYNSDTVNVFPIIQASVSTANNAALPSSISATLTWDGAPAGTYTYSTSGDSPGDALTIAVQAPNVTVTGRYGWNLSVQISGQTTQVFSGVAYVVVQDRSVFGGGWTFGSTDQLFSIPADSYGSAGQLSVSGSGGWRFYQGTSTFVSPADDAGVLAPSGGGYTYTAPDGTVETFNSSGDETEWQSADGQETLQYRYDSSNRLTGMTAIDGGLSTFSYATFGGQSVLSTIQAPGGRTTTFSYGSAYVGVNLATITDPDGGVHTFSYDSEHHLTGENFGLLQNNWGYASNGAVDDIHWGGTSASSATLTPADVEALSTAVAGPLAATYTDPDGGVTVSQLDYLGRVLEQIAPDGGVTVWGRDGAGDATTVTDPLGRVSDYAYDADLYLTQETLPDGGALSWSYQTLDHQLTAATDADGHTSTMAYDGSGRLTSSTDALGDATSSSYNGAGLETSATDADGQSSTMAYDADRRLTSTTDALGATTDYAYDANGFVTTVTDALGRVTTYANDALDRVTQTTDALGGVTSAAYDASGLLLGATDALLRREQSTYDSRGLSTGDTQAVGTPVARSDIDAYDYAGLLTMARDAAGAWTRYAYNLMGELTQTTDALGGVTEAVYDLDGEMTASRDALGHWTYYAYNAVGEVTAVTDALGNVTTTAYDAAGDVTAVTDPLGHTTQYKYDAAGDPTAVIDPLGHAVTTTYDQDGNVSTVTDADGAVTSYAYDALERVTMTTVAVGSSVQATSTVALDAVGNLTSSTDALGHTTQYQYDALDRQTVTIDPLGHRTTTAYDAVGNATTTTDPLGHTVTSVYDQLDRLLQSTDPLGLTTTTVLDALDDVVATIDPLLDFTENYYDLLDRWIGSVDMTGGATRQGYDAAGDATAVTDAVGNQTQYVYDALGRQTVSIDPLGHRTTTTYDAAGDVSTVTDADGREQVFHYDNADRLTAATWLSSAGTTVNLLTYSYDNTGNQLTAADYSGTYTNSYDAQDRLTAQTDPLGLTLTYQYDAASRVTQRADSLGGVLTYVYDNADRLTSEQFGGTGMTQAGVSLGYDAADELTSVTRYSDAALTTLVGTTAYGYDADGRITAITNKNASAATLSYYDYTLNSAGLATQESWQSENTTGGTISGTNTYAYDATDQLTDADGTAYSYDANGNPNGTGDVVGANNELSNDGTWTYTYDAVGNLVEKSKGAGLESWYYTYDTLNRLTSVEQTTNGTTPEYLVTYSYDVYNHRYEEQDWATGGVVTVTKTAYDGDAAWADLSSTLTVQTRYLAGPEVNQWLAQITSSGDEWLLTDRLGSVRDVVNSAGTLVLDHSEYQAFGGVASDTNAAAASAYGLDGERFNRATGMLQSDDIRDVDTQTDQWTGPDPSGFGGGDPNLRRDVGNDPINRIDPSGLLIGTPDDVAKVMSLVTQGIPNAGALGLSSGLTLGVFLSMEMNREGSPAYIGTCSPALEAIAESNLNRRPSPPVDIAKLEELANRLGVGGQAYHIVHDDAVYPAGVNPADVEREQLQGLVSRCTRALLFAKQEGLSDADIASAKSYADLEQKTNKAGRLKLIALIEENYDLSDADIKALELAKTPAEILAFARRADITEIDRIVRELGLSRAQRRMLHDEITRQRYSLDDIWEIARRIKKENPNKK